MVEAGLGLGARVGAWLAGFPARFQRKISQGAYRPEVDGLRFFAIAFVIFGHSIERAARFFVSYRDRLADTPLEAHLQVAPLGVNLFFAISGFILANQAIKADKNPLGASFLKAYFGRRVMRIEPPYILLLVATWAFVSLTGWVPDGTHRFDVAPASLNLSLAGSLFYLHDLIWGTFPRLFPPGWSLEVEVQFYLVAPLLFWLWMRLASLGARAAMAAALLAVGVSLSILDLKTLGPLHVEFSLLHSFNFFWLGIVLAYARSPLAAWIAARPAAFATLLGWLGLALCVALPAPREGGEGVAEVLRLLGVYLGLAAMFVSTFAPASGFRSFCAAPWISLIGGACYSIYLVHLQVTQVFASLAAKLAPGASLIGVAAIFAASALVVVAVGLTYYVFVERRFMTRNWHLLVWAAIRNVFVRRAPVADGPRLVVSRDDAKPSDGRPPASRRRSAGG
ncbi:MAG: acyltransferase [Bradyrhizobium sp.]|nr:MAG: acyltransferase [Bradyrhizobium sp.]